MCSGLSGELFGAGGCWQLTDRLVQNRPAVFNEIEVWDVPRRKILRREGKWVTTARGDLTVSHHRVDRLTP